MPSSPPIYFHFLLQSVSLKNRLKLKRFLALILQNSGRKLKRIDYIFCDDDYLLKINREHLNHDYYTDIVTFDLSENKSHVQAEIYISITRVRDNAAHFKTGFTWELHRVIFHGVLHLAGLSDKTARQRLAMRKSEDQFLLDYFH
jgi:rRNA maturation RNase YbeY